VTGIAGDEDDRARSKALRNGREPRVGPADHHEFLAVQTFDVAPQAAVAGGVGDIGALADDALERHRGGLLMKFRAAPDLMIAVLQG
jgi:hypothetical protein